MFVKTALSVLTGLGLVFLAAGCSGDANRPKLGKVHGKVTYKGTPVSSGHVVFTPVEGKGGASGDVATGEIAADGSYDMTTFNTGDGAILGQHIVSVQVRSGEMPKPKADSTIDYKLPKSLIPGKYTTPDKSPLRCTVVEGSNPFDIELKD
jgi:hypothetical protein